MSKLSLVGFAAVVTLVLLATGCASLRSPAVGLLYTDVAAGENVTESQAGARYGEACATSVLGLIAIGDASIETARRNGGITMITTVDARYYGVLSIIYGKYCTQVRGR